MERLDEQIRAALVARLRARRTAGELTSGEVRAIAAVMGIGERTLWRWLAEESVDRAEAPRADRYVLTEADLEAYMDWRGNVAAMWRARRDAGAPDLPSLRTMQAAFARELTPGERAAAAEGSAGRRRHEVHLRWEASARNQRWEGDHKELPVLVMAPRASRPCKPWATLFLGCYSRLIMGWALSLRPNTATVLAALRSGMVVNEARGPFGGLPATLVPDNGLEFVNTALARVCAVLGIEFKPTPAYKPHRKGKVERVNLTLDQEFLSGLPFYTEGPRAADGRLFGPAADPMGLGLFVDYFAGWVSDYNTTRAHSALGGQTPLERWCADATPIRTVAAEELRWLLLADVERTINKDGIHFDGEIFIAPAMNELVGERVQVRYSPHDLRQIEVFRGDAWLCTAYPQRLLSEADRQAVLTRRREDAAELAARQARASRRARTKLAPITAPGPLTDVTVVTARSAAAGDLEAARPLRSSGEHDLRRLASTSLLGLNREFDYWNPPAPPTGDASLDGAARDEEPR